MQPIRGFRDILQQDFKTFTKVGEVCQHMAELYGYAGIELPILESIDVFKRTLGQTSDVVNKEMFTLQDRSNETLSLRPEATASVARALISNKLTQDLPQKLFYKGPMFRYERPQKGRYRQFYQFGVEVFGISDPYIDAELILMAHRIIEALEIKDFRLEINTIGDIESRQNYNQALVNYLYPYQNELSEDSQTRLHKNPLRILDSKDARDQKIIENAPKFKDFLNKNSHEFFEKVCNYLDNFKIKYTLNQHLVRGLDYYCHTVFEFKHDDLGAQDTFLSGGRYDGLMTMMGGPEVAGVGFAVGIDRVMFLTQPPITKEFIIVIPFDESCLEYALKTVEHLRSKNKIAEISFKGKLAKDLKYAEKKEATYVILIGEDEVKNETITIKCKDKPNETLKNFL